MTTQTLNMSIFEDSADLQLPKTEMLQKVQTSNSLQSHTKNFLYMHLQELYTTSPSTLGHELINLPCQSLNCS